MNVKHITTAELPASIFHGYAYLTATVVLPSGAEEYGYVDPSWSWSEVWASRNDVRPVATWVRTEDIEEGESMAESFARFISETVDSTLDAPQDNGDGTWYGEGSTEMCDDSVWQYALHIVASEHMMRRPDTEYRVSLA